MQFNDKTFCPHILDKSTPIKKYLYCSKLDTLCKMVDYLPSGEMLPKQNVKTLGCPYGYAIQAISKDMGNKNVKESNGLNDITKKTKTNTKVIEKTGGKAETKKDTEKVEQKEKQETEQKTTTTKRTQTTKKTTAKGNAKKAPRKNTRKKNNNKKKS